MKVYIYNGEEEEEVVVKVYIKLRIKYSKKWWLGRKKVEHESRIRKGKQWWSGAKLLCGNHKEEE